jgi:hypothetical protein
MGRQTKGKDRERKTEGKGRKGDKEQRRDRGKVEEGERQKVKHRGRYREIETGGERDRMRDSGMITKRADREETVVHTS